VIAKSLSVSNCGQFSEGMKNCLLQHHAYPIHIVQKATVGICLTALHSYYSQAYKLKSFNQQTMQQYKTYSK